MTNLIVAASLLFVAQAATTTSPEGLALAERFASAVKGETDFEDADFIKPLSAGDKIALRSFGNCRVRHVGYVAIPDKTQSNTVSANPNQLGLDFKCAGVPARTPVAISLHLEAGKIATIETHNAELMRRD